MLIDYLSWLFLMKFFFSKYFRPTVEIKDYNVLIALQPFYDKLIKSKEQTYKAITELINHENYTTGNFLNL